MTDAIDKLLSISGPALLPEWNAADEALLRRFGRLGAELLELLQAKNGLFAFESALHLLPLGKAANRLTLGYWNEPSTWIAEYHELIPRELLYFGQDAFGYQFAVDQEKVFRFDPETADLEPLAKSLNEWADLLLKKFNLLTGWNLAREWQLAYRKLEENERLIPKVPFVVGGEFAVSNLYAADVIEAMRFRASLARQIATLPDGSQVNLKIV